MAMNQTSRGVPERLGWRRHVLIQSQTSAATCAIQTGIRIARATVTPAISRVVQPYSQASAERP